MFSKFGFHVYSDRAGELSYEGGPSWSSCKLDQKVDVVVGDGVFVDSDAVLLGDALDEALYFRKVLRKS